MTFYTTSTTYFNKYKILENNINNIIQEIPLFDINKVTIERNSAKWINDENFYKIYEELQNNDYWIRSSDTNNVWYTFPIILNNKFIGKAEELCPVTSLLLRQLNDINIAGFSLLLPKSQLPIHTDFTGPNYNSIAMNMKLTGGICNLYIKNKNKYNKHRHQIGNAVFFDSEVQHYADNQGTNNRVILYADVKCDYKLL
jgi:aspartyl/asparaginyl beta-hydroxylase (cupin superfamily)